MRCIGFCTENVFHFLCVFKDGFYISWCFKNVSFLLFSSLQSASSSKSSSLETSSSDLEVIIEINSNWGHPSRVGVTEVQFFDLEGQRLTLQPSSLDVRNASESKGELANIVNARMKVPIHLFSLRKKYFS